MEILKVTKPNLYSNSTYIFQVTDYGLPTFTAGQNHELTEHEYYKRNYS